MRIAFVCGFAWEPKGTVRARAHPIAAQLVKLGHEVSIFTCPYDNPAYSSKEWFDQGVRIKNTAIPNWLPTSVTAVAELYRLVARFSPDVVHIFKPKGLSGAFGMLRLFCHDPRPTVLDCDDWEGWGGWNDVLAHPWIVKAFIDFQEKLLVRSMPRITVASKTLLARTRSLCGPNTHVFYVPNCIPAERVSRDDDIALAGCNGKQKLGLPDLPVIFYAGHFEPADDVMFFCRAVSQAAERHRFAVAIVGDGLELPRVREFFSTSRTHVSYFGRVPFETYARILSTADITVFPYPDTPVYRAKCSARILDYMSFSKTILTTAVGENLEYLVHGESAYLVPPGDELAFSAALETLLQDPALRRKLGQGARHRARTDFLWEGAAIQNCLKAYGEAHST